MKKISLLTAALIALGLVSQASASSTVTIGTTTYTVVYVTGSTAFRPNLFNTLTTVPASGSSTPTLWDAGTTITTQPATGVNNTTSAYNVLGTIGGNPYIVSVDLTGSEAGLASLAGSTIKYTVPAAGLTGLPSGGTVTLAGTPKPTGFINPNGGALVTAQPDLAFADTSKAVSLSAAAPLTPYGIVGVIPFTWAKGVNSHADSSWTDLVNVSAYQLNIELGTAQSASFFTGNANDSDNVYLVGRNEGSGTRVNMLCDLFASITTPINQYVANSATYSSAGVLTATASPTFGSGVSIVSVGNDGFDSGSGVQKTLNIDINGTGIVTLGYLGFGDAANLTHDSLASLTGNGQLLTYNGVAENDQNVINGAYTFWGHENLYGVSNQSSSSPGGLVAYKLVGSVQTSLATWVSTSAGALEALGQVGSGTTAQDSAIDAAVMFADRAQSGDTGYPSQL